MKFNINSEPNNAEIKPITPKDEVKLIFNIEMNTDENKSYSSKEQRIAHKFKELVIKRNIESSRLDTEDKLINEISKSRLLMDGVTAQNVIIELKKMGILSKAPIEKEVKVHKEDILETEHIHLKGVTEVTDEQILKQLQDNKFFEKLEKDVFNNEKDLDSLYNKSLMLGNEVKPDEMEKIEYYNEFADAGLITGGREEVKKDFAKDEVLKGHFKNQNESFGNDQSKILEKNKKIATILERGVVYGIANLEWYDGVSAGFTSGIDDRSRATDLVLEMNNENDKNNFTGLGIDVTYRGLYSEKYEEKVFKLFKSIKDGYKTKIKYYKNHKGEMQKEFSVPKTILYFNAEDVKDIVHMIKNIDDPNVKEEFKNSPQKFTVLNQILVQCETLSSFAKKYNNSIFEKYMEIISFIDKLASKNPDFKKMLDSRHENEVSFQMKYLMNKFENIQS